MKRVVIFGATSDIAVAVGKIYAERGYTLGLVGRDPSKMKDISSLLYQLGAKGVYTFIFDAGEFKGNVQLVDRIFEKFERIDICLIAQGVLIEQSLLDESFTKTLELININYISYISLAHLVTTKMTQAGDGVLAGISSVAGDRGKKSNYLYGSTQAAKSVYLDGLRNNLYGTGVQVINLKLGFVDTKMTKDFKKGFLWSGVDSVAQKIVNAIDQRKDRPYVPGYWRYISILFNLIPEWIFKRLNF